MHTINFHRLLQKPTNDQIRGCNRQVNKNVELDRTHMMLVPFAIIDDLGIFNNERLV